jgi:hypothetical protein
MDNIEEIIERTVEKTIARMTVAGVIKVDQKPVTQKTVDLLERYEQLKLSDQPFSKKVVAQIDTALDQIRKDPFFSIIPEIILLNALMPRRTYYNARPQYNPFFGGSFFSPFRMNINTPRRQSAPRNSVPNFGGRSPGSSRGPKR